MPSGTTVGDGKLFDIDRNRPTGVEAIITSVALTGESRRDSVVDFSTPPNPEIDVVDDTDGSEYYTTVFNVGDTMKVRVVYSNPGAENGIKVFLLASGDDGYGDNVPNVPNDPDATNPQAVVADVAENATETYTLDNTRLKRDQDVNGGIYHRGYNRRGAAGHI